MEDVKRWVRAGAKIANKRREESSRPFVKFVDKLSKPAVCVHDVNLPPPRYKAMRAWAQFDGPIRNALHDLKYNKNIGLGEDLAHHLIALFRQYNWAIDLVIPVPLGKERRRQRGYNQAALLAQPFAHELQLPYNPRFLRRIKETRSQVELSFTERQNNVKDAFQAAHQGIQGKKVLVIDDVTTSGSTINACADALMNAGTQAVYGLTVARPGLHG